MRSLLFQTYEIAFIKVCILHLDCTIMFEPVTMAFIREYDFVEVRRLSTMSFNEAGDVGKSFVTQWRWYWKDVV